MISIKVLREKHKIDPGMCQVPWSSAKPDLKSEQQEMSTAAATEHKEETESTKGTAQSTDQDRGETASTASTASTESTESAESTESTESAESTESTNQITQTADDKAQQKENPHTDLERHIDREAWSLVDTSRLGKDLGKEPHEEQGTDQSKDQKGDITQKFGLGINII